MAEQQPASEPTAVDDVRRVREKIAHQHEGDLSGHVAESNRIAQELCEKLNIRIVPAPDSTRRSGTQG
jgi:hypothetical protein